MPRWRNAAPPQNGVNPEALPVPVLSAPGAGSVSIVVPQERNRAPASDSRFMRQGSLVPAAASCWGRDGCCQGLGATRSPALSAEDDTVLFHRTLRRVRSKGNAGHSRGGGRHGRPTARRNARCPAPPFWPEADAPASPGTLPSERGVEGKDGGTLTVGPASDGGTERQRRVPLPVGSSPGMTVKRIAGLASPGEFFPGRGIPGRRRQR
jgi:hypothetical protein